MASILVLPMTLALAAGEQEPSSIPPLELFVTDKKGRPVTDLTRDEVELRIDGRSIALTRFYRVHNGTPVDADSSPEPRRLIVYFDLLHLRVSTRDQMVKKLESFLPKEGADVVETMLVIIDGSGRTHEDFTTDSDKLRDGLESIERQEVSVSTQTERRALDCLLGGSTDQSCPRLVDRYIAELYERTVTALPPLESFFLDLGNVPGHKAFLYISDGLPLKPADEILELQSGGMAMTPETRDLTEEFDLLAEAATTNGVAVYSYRSGAMSVGLTSAANSFQPSSASSMFAMSRERNFQEGPARLSLRTGGWHANTLKEIFTWLEGDLASFYLLDFTADVPTDGRYHEVDVKVKRKKIVVRHPDGYFDHAVRDPKL
jgi:VWFA-related protein